MFQHNIEGLGTNEITLAEAEYSGLGPVPYLQMSLTTYIILYSVTFVSGSFLKVQLKFLS